MMDDADLDALFDSVAGGAPVDWDRVESSTSSPGDRAQVHVLREVARLAEFHHSLQRESAGSAHRADIERWGDLLILERTAVGGGSEVFRAWDRALQREVALKLRTRPEGGAADVADWLEEARMLARVRDPHVVTVYGAAEHDGRVGLWMEYLDGDTLEDEIARRGRLPAAEVARLGVQLGCALQAVHASGTLHRDVKPANIVLVGDARAVLTDLGLGLRRSSEHPTRPFSGTPLFMSPQRLAGGLAKPSDDLYALGVVLWWALAGRPPFRAEALESLRAEVAKGPASALGRERPDAPPALVAAIERAMAVEPGARFASAAELVSAFDAAATALATAPTSRGSARARGAALALAVLLLAAAVLWVSVPRRPRPPAPVPHSLATPAPVAPLYDVVAGFYRRGRQGDIPLETGDRVAPGDQVLLRIRASRPAWVYVLDADDQGETYLLFPQPVFDLRNPLPADRSLALPGTRDGREVAWTVTSRGGHERLLVVVDVAPVPELESELARIPAPVADAPIRYARIGAPAIARMRGMGGYAAAPARRPAVAADRLFERIGALAGREQGVRGTWVRQVVLRNPTR